MLPYVKDLIKPFNSVLMQKIYEKLDPLEDIYQLIDSAIVDDPPIVLREGGIIKEGYNAQADELRKAKTDGKTWLAGLEEREKEQTLFLITG